MDDRGGSPTHQVMEKYKGMAATVAPFMPPAESPELTVDCSRLATETFGREVIQCGIARGSRQSPLCCF